MRKVNTTGKNTRGNNFYRNSNCPAADENGRFADAEWAERLWRLWGAKGKINVGVLHYFALAQNLPKPDGAIYRNTETDHRFLRQAFRAARLGDLVPYDAFLSRHKALDSRRLFTPGIGDRYRNWRSILKESIEKTFRLHGRLMVAKLLPVYVEIWVENSAAAELVEPVARKYNINVIASGCDIPLTEIWQFVRRIAHTARPIRIFYLADLDPHRQNEPPEALLKLEAVLRQYDLLDRFDLKLRNLMLTASQCQTLNLPGKPLSPGEASSCKGRRGVELAAIEARNPGFIQQTLDIQLRRYLDLSKISRSVRAAEEAMQRVISRISKVIDKEKNFPLTCRMIEKELR